MAAVELRHLSKTHADGTRAVVDVDLTIGDGEFFVLVGPSGCGKTTVLRAIAGLDSSISGEVLIGGRDVSAVPANERDIAMVFQSNVLYPHLTVAENIGFALRLAKLGEADVDRRVRAVAGMLQLGHLLDQLPSRLSGGQRQRASIGRAIARTPRVLLMDEPMSNLDAKLRTEMRHELVELQRRLGVTTVYVTHDQIEAMAMADRTAVMRDGRIVQCGPPIDLYTDPVDLFVAQFIGSPTINLVLARLIVVDRGPALRVGSQVLTLDGVSKPDFDRLVERDVVLGLRPEALTVDPSGPLVVSPTHIEQRGVDQLVRATIDARSVIVDDQGITIAPEASSSINVSVAAHTPIDIWQPLRLSLEGEGWHLFDVATGEALAVSTTCRASTTSGAR
jgi:multiple sugar transport system ATP-binding protein